MYFSDFFLTEEQVEQNSLNPSYSGCTSLTTIKTAQEVKQDCLNPSYSGCTSLTMFYNASHSRRLPV
jgi:hypothetical protein